MLPASVWSDCVFAALAADLDYQAGARLAQTCRALAAIWSEFVARDVVDRLLRFHRGMGLRAGIALVRACPHMRHVTMDNIAPAVLPHAHKSTDLECVAETVRCGLPITARDLRTLNANIDASALADLMHVSRIHEVRPHTCAATNARLLMESDDTVQVRWRAVMQTLTDPASVEAVHSVVEASLFAPLWHREKLFHGARVTAALQPVVDALRRAKPHPLVTDKVLELARSGAIHALAPIIRAYIDRFGVPHLPRVFFDRAASTKSIEEALTVHAVEIAAFRLYHAAVGTLFAFRVRPRSGIPPSTLNGGVPPALPAQIDATNAWRFLVHNGLHFVDRPLLNLLLVRTMLPMHPTGGYVDNCNVLMRAYTSAKRYGAYALPPSPAPTILPGGSVSMGDDAWLKTTLCHDYNKGATLLCALAEAQLYIMQQQRKTRAGNILEERAMSVYGLPALFVGHAKQCIIISCKRTDVQHIMSGGAERIVTGTPYGILLAKMYCRPLDRAIIVTWTPLTLQLAERCTQGEGPLRHRLLCYFAALGRSDAKLDAHAVPVPRCSACNRFLSDAHSVQRGRGDHCAKRIRH